MTQRTARAPGAVDKVIGARIRAYRHRRKLSQSELAGALGLIFQQVQKYEHGITRVGAARLIDISRVLQVPLLKLYPDDVRMSPLAQRVSMDIDEVSTFMGSAEGWRLCRAFVRISDSRARKRTIALVVSPEKA